MTLKPRTICLLCSLGLAIAQQQQQDTFRGAPFLSSELEVRSRFDVKECKRTDHDEKTCRFEFSLPQTNITGLLTFQRDALVKVGGAFLRDRFGAMRDAFSERYGKPISQTDELVQWKSGSVAVELDFIEPKDSAIVPGSDALAKYSRNLDFALQKHALRLKSAVAIFKINYDRREYERAKDKADHEYERDCDEAKSEYESFKPPPYSSFSITVGSYAVEVARRKSEDAKKSAEALR
jgi:hypothetical protein